MSIPFNDKLQWDSYQTCPNWFKETCLSGPAPAAADACQDHATRVIIELLAQLTKEPVVRGIQCTRDSLRLVLKVPIRALCTPIWLKQNWKERERAKINAKLTGYSFVQLVSVPPKFMVALTALLIVPARGPSKWLINKSDDWTDHLDGRAAQLEALKEVGRQNAETREEYNQYKAWLYSIDPALCRKKKLVRCC